MTVKALHYSAAEATVERIHHYLNPHVVWVSKCVLHQFSCHVREGWTALSLSITLKMERGDLCLANAPFY